MYKRAYNSCREPGRTDDTAEVFEFAARKAEARWGGREGGRKK